MPPTSGPPSEEYGGPTRIVADDEDDVARPLLFHRVLELAQTRHAVIMRRGGRRLPRAGRTSATADLRPPVLRLVVFPNQPRDIHARHRVRRHLPGRRRLPIATI